MFNKCKCGKNTLFLHKTCVECLFESSHTKIPLKAQIQKSKRENEGADKSFPIGQLKLGSE